MIIRIEQVLTSKLQELAEFLRGKTMKRARRFGIRFNISLLIPKRSELIKEMIKSPVNLDFRR